MSDKQQLNEMKRIMAITEGDPNDTDWDAHWAREDGDDERADDLEADAEFARMDDELDEGSNDNWGVGDFVVAVWDEAGRHGEPLKVTGVYGDQVRVVDDYGNSELMSPKDLRLAPNDINELRGGTPDPDAPYPTEAPALSLSADAAELRVEEDMNDERGKMCPVCIGGRREGYGRSCPNCDGEGYVAEEGVQGDIFKDNYPGDPEGVWFDKDYDVGQERRAMPKRYIITQQDWDKWAVQKTSKIGNPIGKPLYTDRAGIERFIVGMEKVDEPMHLEGCLQEGTSKKIGCIKCDEVSTAKAWQENDDVCPKCHASTQGVQEGERFTGKTLASVEKEKRTGKCMQCGEKLPKHTDDCLIGRGLAKPLGIKEERDRSREWTSRSFNAVGPPKGPWYVEDRLAIRDEIVAGPFDDYDKAWAVADEMQANKGKKEADWYKRGNKGMWGGDVHMNSNLDEDPEEFKRDLQNPQWRERREEEIRQHDKHFAPHPRSGKSRKEDLFMARVKTPRGKGTVYSINNYEPSEAHPEAPTIAVRLDSDPGGYGGGARQYNMWLSDVEILPYDEMGEPIEEVGVKHDSYGATPVYEDDPDSMGSYDILWNDESWKEAIPYDQAEKEVERILQIIDDSALQAHDNNDHLKVKKTNDGDSVEWTVLDPIDGDYQKIRVQPSDMPAGYTGESIDLRSIVENVLQEYPGQPKDYDDDEFGPAARGKSDIMIDAGAEDMPMGDYEQDEIDPEYEDSELGYRFD